MFGGIGLLLFSYGLVHSTRRAVVLLTWPEARTVVTASQVEKAGQKHRARLEVRFLANSETIETESGHDYEGKAYAWIAEAVARHPRGSETVVRYDRSHPETALLDRRFDLRTFGVPLLSAFAGLVFGGVGLLAFRSANLHASSLMADSEHGRQRAARLEFLGVGGFVLAIGVACVVAALAVLPSRLEARRWPVVEARFDHGDVVSENVQVGKRGGTVYVPRLFLTYVVDRKEYVSTIRLRTSSGHREKTERLVAKIPKGQIYRIRVDPGRPHRVEAEDAWPLLLPGVLFFAGLVVAGASILVIRSTPVRPPGRRRRRSTGTPAPR
ncbi:MAG: DUF3592 domain-containing protein [Holophagales bacterium]|nr:DUF3592 domain-containing protein [Holophagales bacterium]